MGLRFQKIVIVVVPAFMAFSQSLFDSNRNQADNPYIVGRKELLSAMKSQIGYDSKATTNVARFHADVIFDLTRKAKAVRPMGPPILIKHEDWFYAFLEVTELSPDKAPIYSKLAYEHKQDQLIEYRTDRVIKKVKRGPNPKLALNVKVWWPKTPKAPSRYTYCDTLSIPKLKITNERVISYKLLDFGDVVVYDKITGLKGKPTSGILKIITDIIGEGNLKSSRMTISKDGLQIVRAKAKKFGLTISATVTISPNGHMEKGVPQDRPDLLKLEKMLKEEIDIEYQN